MLKAHDRHHQIHWWVSAELQELLISDPDLDGLFLFERRGWALPRYWGELFKSVRELRAQRFDLVLDLQGLARSSLIAWLTRAQLSIGMEDWREGAPGLYDRVIPRPSPLTHAVDWYLETLKALDVPIHWDFEWLPLRPAAAENVQRTWRPAAAPWIVIIPGARWSNKRWPAQNYAQVVRNLARAQADLRFVVLGGRSDAELGAAICQGAGERCLDLTGRTSLSELIEWVRLSSAVITNDTGPMHIAAALKKPVVSIFGPTEPRRTGPYGQLSRAVRIDLPCAPCLKPVCHWHNPLECLRAIGPELVCARVRQVLFT